MITKGIVEELKGYQAKVRLPIYDGLANTKNATSNENLSYATVCVTTNLNNSLNVGDIVYVSFEDNDKGKPVILGQLYKEEMNTLADIKLNSANINQLTVNKNASLPQNTSIGSISSKEIAALSGIKDNIQNQIDINLPAINFAESERQKSETDGAIVHEKELSNPNLLINGDFRVNQRGKTSYTHTGEAYGYTYFVDRWFAWGQNPFTFNASTKTLTPNTSNTGNSILSQWIEDVSGILGKTITYSVSTNDTVYSKTLNIPTTLSNNVSLGELSTSFGKLRVWSNNNRLRFDIIVSYNQSIVLNYAKVEIGSMATAFSPRPYAEELAMCQRYNVDLIRNTTGYPYVAMGFARNATKLFVVLNLPQAMRVRPTVFVYEGLYLQGSNKSNELLTSSNVTFGGFATNGNQISLTITTTGLTAGQCYGLQLRDNGHIGIDAEIY